MIEKISPECTGFRSQNMGVIASLIEQKFVFLAVPELVYPGTTPSSRREHQRVATFKEFARV